MNSNHKKLFLNIKHYRKVSLGSNNRKLLIFG